ncbi:MAG TPA: iron-sulfur cluster assembly scaffold protein, partial [Chloroflexi bacterium]|nr:iron-sulfur cluster assembly scaffold protein [Chloroflexota bacterium]
MDRQEQIEILVDHYQNPRHRHAMDNPSVTMPGGNPGCGDVITIYLQPGDDGLSIADVSWEGEGCTISQAAASILMEMVHDERWTLEEALAHDYTT